MGLPLTGSPLVGDLYPRLMVFQYLHSLLRVETLSFEEAADFNPRVNLFRLTP